MKEQLGLLERNRGSYWTVMVVAKGGGVQQAILNSEPMAWSSWAEPDGEVIGYMCRTDFECELGAASGGNTIYPSVEDLKRYKPCAESCGVVEVEVRYRRIVEPGTMHDDEND